MITGRWIFWPRRPTFGSAEPTQTGFWAKVGRWIAPRPRQVWVVTSVLLAIACLGLLRLDTNGLATEDSYTKEFQSITGQKALVDAGLVDQSNTVMVVANAGSEDAIAEALTGLDNVEPPKPAVTSGEVTFVEAAIGSDPASPVAFDTVERVRDAVHAVDGADALVGGNSAFYLDTKDAANRDNVVIIPIILLMVLLILMALLRSILAPLILIVTVVLSFGGALGISALLFEYVFGFAGSDPGFPLFAFVFLVALGIDYNIFLMTRVREETMHLGTRKGALVALTSTGGVITSRRSRARGDVPGAGDHPGRLPGPARCRGRPRRHPRHDDRPLGARHRDQHGPRRQDLVAEQARQRGPPPQRRRDRGADRDRALIGH